MTDRKLNIRAVFQASALGGGLAGLIAGALGGAFAASLESIAPPVPDIALRRALLGAVIGVAAGVLGGLPAAWLASREERRFRSAAAAFATVFWSTAAAAVEATQVGASNATAVFVFGVLALPVLGMLLLTAGRGLWKARWGVVAFLVLCLVGEILDRITPITGSPFDPLPEEVTVQLWSATIPEPLGAIAAHHWFLSFDPAEGRWHRWELWQFAHQCPTSWGHVHCDLLPLTAGTGGGPARFRREWHGPDALALRAVLLRSYDYPYRGRYFAWPGPNSNTYIAWVFRESGVGHDIDCRGIGQDYLGRTGAGVTTTGTGLQIETSLLGLRVGKEEGVELHFACFVFGVDFWRPALKTPLGRFGFTE